MRLKENAYISSNIRISRVHFFKRRLKLPLPKPTFNRPIAIDYSSMLWTTLQCHTRRGVAQAALGRSS